MGSVLPTMHLLLAIAPGSTRQYSPHESTCVPVLTGGGDAAWRATLDCAGVAQGSSSCSVLTTQEVTSEETAVDAKASVPHSE